MSTIINYFLINFRKLIHNYITYPATHSQVTDSTVAKSPFLPSNSQRWYFPCFIERFIVECTWQYMGFVSKLTSLCVTLPEAQCVILLTELWRYLLPCSVMPSTTSQVDIHSSYIHVHSSYSWIKNSHKFKNKNPGHLFMNSLMFDSVISCYPESGVHVSCSSGLTSTPESTSFCCFRYVKEPSTCITANFFL